MAYTKIHAIKRTLSKALEYIENPEKTDGSLLVTGYNLEPECASLEMTLTQIQAQHFQGNRVHFNQSSNLAYHMIQSFSPSDDVTPEQAHALGQRLADELLQGRYEYVVATHIDKGHIHNHIIFNATSFLDYKKFRTNPTRTAREIRSISDQLCADAGLSIIDKPQLGRAYRYAPFKAGYKTMIRKRIRIALEAATSWDDYRDALQELGVHVQTRGQTTSYYMAEQERGTRADQLGKDGEYLDAAIEDRLEANHENISQLKRQIEECCVGAPDYKSFIAALEERGVTARKTRNGVKYLIGEDNEINEWAMGPAYSTDAIKAAIVTGENNFRDDANPVDLIVQRFKDTDLPIKEAMPVTISAHRVRKTTKDGIVIDVPTIETEEALSVFIEKNNIRYDSQKETFTIAVAAGLSYVLKKEDGSIVNKRGEELIRRFERAENIPPEILTLNSEDVIAISTKGVMIAVPDLGVKRLFVPQEFVECDALDNGGKVEVAIWKDWSYSFTGDDDRQKYVAGKDLISVLNKRQNSLDNSLGGRIKAMQRRNLLAETKELANVLNRLHREDIKQIDDFETKINKLLNRAEQLKKQIGVLEEKNSQYKLAVKYLMAVHELEPVELELQLLRKPKRREEYRQAHASELTLLQRSREELQRMNVNCNVDPDKVQELVRQQDREVADLSAITRELANRVIALQETKNAVEAIVEPQSGKNEYKKQDR